MGWKPRWLGDGWLWRKTGIPEDVRVTSLGRLTAFAQWRQRKQWEEEEEVGFGKGGKGGKGGGYQEDPAEDPAKELGYKNLFESECRRRPPVRPNPFWNLCCPYAWQVTGMNFPVALQHRDTRNSAPFCLRFVSTAAEANVRVKDCFFNVNTRLRNNIGSPTLGL